MPDVNYAAVSQAASVTENACLLRQLIGQVHRKLKRCCACITILLLLLFYVQFIHQGALSHAQASSTIQKN
jgi:hypothetical protein